MPLSPEDQELLRQAQAEADRRRTSDTQVPILFRLAKELLRGGDKKTAQVVENVAREAVVKNVNSRQDSTDNP